MSASTGRYTIILWMVERNGTRANEADSFRLEPMRFFPRLLRIAISFHSSEWMRAHEARMVACLE